MKAHSEVDQTTANLAYQNQQLVVINANEDVAKARVGSAEAALLSAKFALADTAVLAPINGIVANRKTRVGEYVAAGTRMLSIVPINDLWVEANYRETQIGRMKVGDPVRIDVDTYPSRPICGYVEAILPAAGSESHPTAPRAISQRSYAASRCACGSTPATPTPLSPVRACQWKRPSRSPRQTTPLQRNEAPGWLRVRSIEGHGRAVAHQAAGASRIGRARPQGASDTQFPTTPAH